jgi:hypothetical protein
MHTKVRIFFQQQALLILAAFLFYNNSYGQSQIFSGTVKDSESVLISKIYRQRGFQGRT